MKALLPALARPLIEDKLPDGLDIVWFQNREEAEAHVGDADIGWLDLQRVSSTREVAAMGEKLQWLFTIRAGIDAFDTDLLQQRGTVLTNGTGFNSSAIAEYAVMGILVAAKRFDEVVRLADGHEWTTKPPGTMELTGSSALVIGYGTIGRLIAERLRVFGVDVTGVTRSGRDGTLTPDQWRERLPEFDWVILSAPATPETETIIGEDELTAMKPTAWLVNVARGSLVDQNALVTALNKYRIGGAFLDTVTPEPLPEMDKLWSAHNVIMTMHLSGRSQSTMYQNGAALFLRNLDAFLNGRTLENVVDLGRGY
ncbi:phosphoglycerate dehydrogenase-like enzyme [Stakelama sediminis]|uniref:Phosphoglycerate dehydrogenase-like enzyme n=1 Tax=Stakelama sediminis TaxID=463200 RepID=A0A840YYI9_9SPHN|nr:D-2-hydroxyacid dehydrogenase [Stakelama sediminis]MBB5718599.1 phosphoglycerate dehydrogenase-like enzyme [Stakelama sediminis]